MLKPIKQLLYSKREKKHKIISIFCFIYKVCQFRSIHRQLWEDETDSVSYQTSYLAKANVSISQIRLTFRPMGLALVTKLNAELMHGQFIAVTFKAVDFSYHSISHTLASLQFLLILVHFIHKLESFHLLLHISIGCQCVTSEYTLNVHVASNILRNTDKLIVPFLDPCPLCGPLCPLWDPWNKMQYLFLLVW